METHKNNDKRNTQANIHNNTQTNTHIDTRARARLAAVKVENDGLNESWRFGQFRFDIQPDGRR